LVDRFRSSNLTVVELNGLTVGEFPKTLRREQFSGDAIDPSLRVQVHLDRGHVLGE